MRSVPRAGDATRNLPINQASRSGTAGNGSMSEIGNVPIFSGSESRFREGPRSRARRARNDRCDKCNYLRSIKSTSTSVCESPRVPEAARKRFRSKPPIGELSRVCVCVCAASPLEF